MPAVGAGFVSLLLVAACSGRTANDAPEPAANGGEGSALGEDGGTSSSMPVAGNGSGGISLVDPDGTGGTSSLASDGCDCAGDDFGARVWFEEDEDEALLELNRRAEARCPVDAPAHAELTNGCAGDRLSLWLGYDADGAPPWLTVLGSSVIYVDRAGVTWMGSLGYYPAPEVDAQSVIVGELEVLVQSEAGASRTLHVSYKLCVRYLPRALVIC